jgi:type IV fimbrial biogenesis protein FimT
MKNNKGFTLLELIVAISIAGILMALAIPSFRDMIRGSRLTTTINEIVGSLNYARSEAIKRGTNIVVKPVTANNWESGWTVAVSSPCTVNCVLRAYPALKANYTLRGTVGASITYSSLGTAGQSGNLVLCETSGGSTPKSGYVKAISINFVGRINSVKDTNNNGIPDISGVDLTSCT